MDAPAEHDEATAIVNHLDQRQTPCRSGLSVGGVIKQVAQGLEPALDRLAGVEHPPVDEATFAAYTDGFVVRDDETVTSPTPPATTTSSPTNPSPAPCSPSRTGATPPLDGRLPRAG